jgi:hypothetical protein
MNIRLGAQSGLADLVMFRHKRIVKSNKLQKNEKSRTIR